MLNRTRLLHLLALLLVIGAFGGSVVQVPGVQVTLYRAALIIGVLVAAYSYLRVMRAPRGVEVALAVFGIGASLYAATTATLMDLPMPDLTPGAMIVASVIVVGYLARRGINLESISRWWTFGFLITCVLVALEVTRGVRLNPEFYLTASDRGGLNLLPVFTFRNPNDLGAFAVLSLVIMWQWSRVQQSARLQLLLLGAVLALIAATNTRSALIGVVALLPFLLRSLAPMRRTLAILGIAVGGAVLLGNNTAILSKLAGVTAELTPDGSAGVRLNILLCGGESMWRTLGFGVGGGNWVEYMRAGNCDLETSGVYSMHNSLFKIAVEYGLWITLIGAVIVARWYRVVQATQAGHVLLLGLIALATAGVASSDLLAINPAALFAGWLIVTSGLPVSAPAPRVTQQVRSA